MNFKNVWMVGTLALLLMLACVSIGSACTEKTTAKLTEKTYTLPSRDIPGYYTISGDKTVTVDRCGKIKEIKKASVTVTFVNKSMSERFIGTKNLQSQDQKDNQAMLSFYMVKFLKDRGVNVPQSCSQSKVKNSLTLNAGKKVIRTELRIS
jgi:hypothetical protein